MLMLAAALMGVPGPVSMRDWKEWVPPSAPFRIDVPGELKAQPDEQVGSGSVTHSWEILTGHLSVRVSVNDSNYDPVDTVHGMMNVLGHRFTDTRKNPTLALSDLTVAGYPAAKIVFEYDLDSGGRYHGEELTVRVGQDDWSIYTGHMTTEDWAFNAEAHIYASLKAPLAIPALSPASAGRLSYKAPGKPVTSEQALDGDWATYFDSWTLQAFDDGKGSKIWVSHMKVKPGQQIDPVPLAQFFADSVKEQSDDKPNMFAINQEVAGRPGAFARGTLHYSVGYQDGQVVAVGDGSDYWTILAGGPNDARTEAMFNAVIASMKIAP